MKAKCLVRRWNQPAGDDEHAQRTDDRDREHAFGGPVRDRTPSQRGDDADGQPKKNSEGNGLWNDVEQQ